MFRHLAPSAQLASEGRADLPTLLDSQVIPQGAVGWTMDVVFAQWARRTQCTALIVHDPYLCGVRHSTEMYPATERMTDEEFLATFEGAGLGRTTGLALVDELTRTVDHASGFLTSVRLHTRGSLRSGVPAGRFASPGKTSWAVSMS